MLPPLNLYGSLPNGSLITHVSLSNEQWEYCSCGNWIRLSPISTIIALRMSVASEDDVDFCSEDSDEENLGEKW